MIHSDASRITTNTGTANSSIPQPLSSHTENTITPVAAMNSATDDRHHRELALAC